MAVGEGPKSRTISLKEQMLMSQKNELELATRMKNLIQP